MSKLRSGRALGAKLAEHCAQIGAALGAHLRDQPLPGVRSGVVAVSGPAQGVNQIARQAERQIEHAEPGPGLQQPLCEGLQGVQPGQAVQSHVVRLGG